VSKRKELVLQLEEGNSELAKEILLNESAIYEAQKEMADLDNDLLDHPSILNYINTLRLLIERIEKRNDLYKTEIFDNELRIQKLKRHGKD
jgi:hypothetical protein